MLSWTDKWLLKLVVVWACADLVALSVSPRRMGLWVVVVMLVVGTTCKIVIAGLFVFMCLKERKRKRIEERITSIISSPLLPFPRVTLKAMSISAENIMGNLPPGDCTKLLMILVRESGMLLVDGLMVSPQLTSDNLLGEGPFSRVYELNLADVKKPACIKVKKKNTHTDYYFMWEVDNLQRLSGIKGVPRVLAVSVVPKAFIMTRHGRRTLEAWIKIWEMANPKETEVADVLHQLCHIMVNLHALQVCHNDLKSDNVMVEVDETQKKMGSCFRVTLIDFTILCNYGSYPYDVPRAMFLPHNDPGLMRAERRCSEATDVYSMGYLLHRSLPFFTSQRRGTIEECSRRAMGPCHLRPSFLEIEKVLDRATK